METKEKEISLLLFFNVFRRCIWWMIGAVVAGVLIAALYTKLLATPKYSSTAEFMVDMTASTSSTVSSQYQTGMETKAANIASAITGNVFLQEVAKEYNQRYATEITSAYIAKHLSTEVETGIAAFHVKAVSQSPEEAYRLILVLQDMVPNYLKYVNEEQYLKYNTPDKNGNLTEPPFYVYVISEGHLPVGQDSPSLIRNVCIGGLGMLVVVYLFFFLRALLDKTVYSSDTLKENFDIPVLGEIPQWVQTDKSEKAAQKERRAIKQELRNDKSPITRNYQGRILSEKTPFLVSESFKTLRTNLIYTCDNKDHPVVGIFSAFPGAGKSLLAANCAIGFAQLGKKILLIDGDMRCPEQNNIFNVEKEHQGLSEYLVGLAEDPLTDCVAKTSFEGLDLMPCGRIPPNPGELLASDRMDGLLAAAKEKYDYILIDLPPVFETLDAGVVARCVTGYLMVVRYAYSNLRAVADSLASVEAVNGKVMGFVVNDLPEKLGSYGLHGGKKYSKYGNTSYYRYDKHSHTATQNENRSSDKS